MKNGNGKIPHLSAQKRQIVKIAICIPSRGVCDAGFTFDLANLMSWTSLELVSRGVDMIMNMQMSSYIHANRTDLASIALQDKDVTHLFWLDDDMRFPKNAIARLLQHHQPFVGVNYSHRKPPPQPVALKRNAAGRELFRCSVCNVEPSTAPLMRYDATKQKVVCLQCGETRWAQNAKLITNAQSTGLEPAEAIGFGVTLVAREVFEQTPFPWFLHDYDHVEKRAIGEDTWFCWKAQEAGFPVFVDHDLSKDVRHAGSLEYSLEHAENWAAMQLEQQRADELIKSATEARAQKPKLVSV